MSILGRQEIQHSVQRVARLEIVQEPVAPLRRIVCCDPMPMTAVDLAPMAASLSGTAVLQHLALAQVCQAVAQFPCVAHWQSRMRTAAGREQLGYRAAISSGQPLCVSLQSLTNFALSQLPERTTSGAEPLLPLQRMPTQNQRPSKPVEDTPSAAAPCVIDAIHAQVCAAIAQFSPFTDGKNATSVSISAQLLPQQPIVGASLAFRQLPRRLPLHLQAGCAP